MAGVVSGFEEHAGKAAQGKPVQHVNLVQMGARVRLTVWSEVQQLFSRRSDGDVVLVTRLRMVKGVQGAVELQTTKITTFEEVPRAMAEEITAGTSLDKDASASVSGERKRRDYAGMEATRVTGGTLGALVVHNEPRELDEVFEPHHCIVMSLDPLGNNDHLFYIACATCSKKHGSCEHSGRGGCRA